MATLTYVYADSTCVLGPLATYAEPHTYDLCADHATRLTAPRGWDVVRLAVDMTPPEPTPDDLVALAEAVRTPSATAQTAEVTSSSPSAVRRSETADPGLLSTENRRRHLRAIDGDGEATSAE